MSTIDILKLGSPRHSQLASCGRYTFLVILAAWLMLLGTAAHAEKTISYYTDNVGERIDRVLACRDGAEDPASLGCRNASAAQEMDVLATSRFYRKLELKKWQAQSNSNKNELKVILAMQGVHSLAPSDTCVPLIDGKEPATPLGKASLKLSLQEKFIVPQANPPGKYRVTAKGDEYLRALGQSSKTGMFCPTAIQYVPDVKVLQFRDLTAQYKGKKNPAGDTVKAVAVTRVSFELANPSASIWLSKKIMSLPLPSKGVATGEYVLVDFQSKSSYVVAGGLLTVDGQAVLTFSAEEFLKRFK